MPTYRPLHCRSSTLFVTRNLGWKNIGKKALIKRALYCGKSAGHDYRNYLRACMRHLDFQSCLSDPDVWMRPTKRNDGSEYFKYCLLYTEDELKKESIGEPNLYLGGRVRKV